MDYRKLALALMAVLVLAAPVFAGSTAQVSGTVVDESGVPIELATIKILGTSIFVTTDEDGYYSRTDIDPGVYDVLCSVAGFQDFKVTEVTFLSDVRRNINFTMQKPTDVSSSGIVIISTAERRLIERDKTSSIDYITAEDIEALPADNFYDLMANEAGAVNDDGFMHVRGGRSTEIVYMVDDIPIISPINNGAGTAVNNTAIAEMSIISGTFSAEYGNAQSAVVNIITKSGSTDSFHGTLRGTMEIYRSTKEFDSQKLLASTYHPDPDKVPVSWTTRTRQGNLWKGEAALGGPIGDFATFFLSGEYFESGGSFIVPSPRKEYNAQGKLRFKFNNDMQLTFSGTLSQRTLGYFDVRWQYTLDNYIKQWRDTYQAGFLWKHIVSEDTYYTIRGNYYNSWRHIGTVWGDDDWNYVDDGNGGLVQQWDNGDAWGDHTLGGMKWWEDYDLSRMVSGADGWFYTGGDMRYWETTKEVISTAKFDISSELDQHNLVKGGLEYKYYDVSMFQRQPSSSNTYGDKYRVFPWQAAVYVQDKMDYSEMVINLGLRFDYFEPNADYPEDPMDSQDSNPNSDNETFDDIPRVIAAAKYQLSPRLGIAYPISEMDKIHFSYGHFFQMPQFSHMYRSNYEKPIGAYPIFGNPDLKPEKTISYEVGVQHLFTDDILGDLTAFYKDISGQIDSDMYRHPQNLYNYTRTINADWGNVKGLEVVLDGRWTDWFTSKISYTYSVARGLASSWRQGYNYAYQRYNLPLEANLLDWDTTHTFNIMFDFRHEAFGLNINFNVGSGTPYSPPSSASGQPKINSERMPWTMGLDAKATYTLELGGMSFGLFLEGFNLMDRWNVTNFGADEGDGNGQDWTYAYEDHDDPDGPWDDVEVYGEPLQFRGGVSFSF